MLTQHYGLGTSIFTSIVAGVLAGIITGIVHTKLMINSLLSGIIVMTGLYSINLILMGRSNLPLISVETIFTKFSKTQTHFSELIIIIIISVLLISLVAYLLSTDFGLAMRATGNNELMVRAIGVNTDKMKIIGMGIANGLTGLSGSIVSQYQGFADINMGIGIVIFGLGSVMIGESIMNLFNLKNIIFRLIGVALGSVIFRLLIALVLVLGADPNQLRLITSLLVLIFVAIPNLIKRKS